MPTYDYECLHCGYKFEAFHSMSAKSIEKCPKCHKKVKRLIGSGAGLIFKGSGFYATDYKNKSKGGTPKPQGPACPKADQGCGSCPHNG
ncbi:MAG: zinc ribbon domain-containing protein [Candidatus Omnitrophica bacterium]|nr:zinc ribbon domain-containing protein [Candidatus Omnitrophota bacterium]MBU1869572.1 zinc ribbon domain-containing protein [Candidatus Omnitrophota bacterium]